MNRSLVSSIFSYGQTGSGKTYTMEGPPGSIPKGDLGEIGIIPRAVNKIFDSMKDLESRGWRYEIEVSFLEIYNESIRDLLGEAGTNKRHEIKHDPHNDATSVTDLSRSKNWRPRTNNYFRRNPWHSICFI